MTTNVKNSDSKKVVDLTTKENKEKFVSAKKEQIKNSDSKKEVDFFKNLDFLNVNDTIKDLSLKNTNDTKEVMYNYPTEILGDSKKEKSFRTKLRSKLSNFVDTFLFNVFNDKDEQKAKDTFNNFKDFYFKNYKKNDYSILSLSANNRDKDIKEKRLILFLETIKKLELI